MDGILYPASLLLLAVLAFTFNQNNNSKLALLMIVIGAYIVYSHETGDSATAWKDSALESLDESATEYSKKHGTEGFDANKAKKVVEEHK